MEMEDEKWGRISLRALRIQFGFIFSLQLLKENRVREETNVNSAFILFLYFGGVNGGKIYSYKYTQSFEV